MGAGLVWQTAYLVNEKKKKSRLKVIEYGVIFKAGVGGCWGEKLQKLFQ